MRPVLTRTEAAGADGASQPAAKLRRAIFRDGQASYLLATVGGISFRISGPELEVFMPNTSRNKPAIFSKSACGSWDATILLPPNRGGMENPRPFATPTIRGDRSRLSRATGTALAEHRYFEHLSMVGFRRETITRPAAMAHCTGLKDLERRRLFLRSIEEIADAINSQRFSANTLYEPPTASFIKARQVLHWNSRWIFTEGIPADRVSCG